MLKANKNVYKCIVLKFSKKVFYFSLQCAIKMLKYTCKSVGEFPTV